MVKTAKVWGYDVIYKHSQELNKSDKYAIKKQHTIRICLWGSKEENKEYTVGYK